MGVLIGVDIGGTFTDIIGIDLKTKQSYTGKVPTTNNDHSIGFLSGIDNVLEKMNRPYEDIRQIVHGTTIGTNAILEENGAKIGIITTKGFEDTLEIGRQKRSDMYNLFMDPETPGFLCPRYRRRGISERIDPHTGDILIPINEETVLRTVTELVEEHHVESIAVSYLYSFVNSKHERMTKEIIEKNFPHVSVSLSSEIDPNFREYERLCLTAFDAYIKPIINDYISKLINELSQRGIIAPIYIMLSQGGGTGVKTLQKRSVGTLLSGVAAGVLGGREVGRLSTGLTNMITLDVGGTSADVSLIVEGKSLIATEGSIRSYPLRIPMVDINTIGAGGGSIACVDEAGNLRVGPESAGAIPGPVCYGRGGEKPTVTDASLILGYLKERGLAGGSLPLDKSKAERALQKYVAKPLNMNLTDAAMGIHQIINAFMADAIHLVTVKRGYDPRKFALVSFGGAGGIHACAVAENLGINKIIVPATSGVLSANGLIVADIESQESKSIMKNIKSLNISSLINDIKKLEQKCAANMKNDNLLENNIQKDLTLNLRYSGQSYDIPINIRYKDVKEINIEQVIQSFHEHHERVYGHSDSRNEIEIVSIRVTYKHPVINKELKENIHIHSGKLADGDITYRDVYFNKYKKYVKTPIYTAISLPIGKDVSGPIIVELSDSTIVVNPEWSITMLENGNMVINRK